MEPTEAESAEFILLKMGMLHLKITVRMTASATMSFMPFRKTEVTTFGSVQTMVYPDLISGQINSKIFMPRMVYNPTSFIGPQHAQGRMVSCILAELKD